MLCQLSHNKISQRCWRIAWPVVVGMAGTQRWKFIYVTLSHLIILLYLYVQNRINNSKACHKQRFRTTSFNDRIFYTACNRKLKRSLTGKVTAYWAIKNKIQSPSYFNSEDISSLFMKVILILWIVTENLLYLPHTKIIRYKKSINYDFCKNT